MVFRKYPHSVRYSYSMVSASLMTVIVPAEDDSANPPVDHSDSLGNRKWWLYVAAIKLLSHLYVPQKAKTYTKVKIHKLMGRMTGLVVSVVLKIYIYINLASISHGRRSSS